MRWMSFWTSFSSNLRPIRRVTAYSVFFALVTAWRLAEAPTRISPSSWYATIDGVVRAPSLFSITLGVLPSITATHDLVVPRAMPMILPMFFLLAGGPRANFKSDVGYLWISCVVSSWTRGSFRRRNGHQRGPQDPLRDQVALLQYVDHRV